MLILSCVGSLFPIPKLSRISGLEQAKMIEKRLVSEWNEGPLQMPVSAQHSNITLYFKMGGKGSSFRITDYSKNGYSKAIMQIKNDRLIHLAGKV